MFTPRLVAKEPPRKVSLSITPITIKIREESVINEPDKKFQDLFNESVIYEQKKKENIEKHFYDIKTKANNKKINSQSEKITNEIKNNVFKKIFSILDTNGENKLGGSDIDLELLPEKIQNIFQPLVKELKDQEESLSDEEFIVACVHLYEVN